MRIAITGATGFVGRYIVERLVGRGDTCRCWFRNGSNRSGFEQFASSIEWVEGELGDRQSARTLVDGCQAVVHAALYHPSGGFQGGEGDIVTFAEKNIVGSLLLIEEARAAGVERFLFVSTCAVHDKILDDRPLDEAHPLWPFSHYGAHKAAIEQFVHSYGFGQKYPICAVRPCGVYGLAMPPEDSKWFDMVRKVVQGQTVDCRRGGKEVHARDVSKAISLLLDAPAERIAGESFSCCDRYVSEHEVATIAHQVSGSSAKIEGQATRPKHEIDTSKIRSLKMAFGGRPLLEATIAEMVRTAR